MFKLNNARNRHLLKTITWRFIGSIDTLIISSIITGNLVFGSSITLIEVLTKSILYYTHERMWFKSSFKNSKSRHIFKTFSWRFLATTDTVLISYLITGNLYVGFKIGGLEIITKMILYFLHEKIWYRTDYGILKKLERKNV